MPQILLDDPAHAGGSSQLLVGTVPNDGTGDPARTAGLKLKQWAADLNTMLSSQSGQAYVAPGGATPINAALQAAINLLAAAGGGTLYLGAGTYTLNNPVTLANNVSIIGVPTAFPPSTHLLSNTWTPSGGTIITAGTATQGFIWNSTNNGSVTNWGANQLGGVVLENLCFSGFTGQALKTGAQNAEGLVMSRMRRLGFYNCGSQGTTYLNGTFALECRNHAGNNLSEMYFAKCANGLLYQTSVAQATQQLGNSTLSDIQVDGCALANPNFSRAVVLGADPNIATSFDNEMRVNALAIYYFIGRSTITGTASFAGGTTFTLSAGLATNFPVGMPVRFTAGSGNIVINQTYLVLTNDGTNISIGNSRGASAITLPGSGTLTIQQLGYPLLDLGGPITTTSGEPSSIFWGLDIEGGALGSIYAENSVGLDIHLNQVTNAGTGIVLRNSQATIRNSAAAFTIDEDGASGASIMLGNVLKGPNVGYPMGLYTDGSNSTPGLTVGPSMQRTSTAPDLVVKGSNGFLYPNVPWGETIQTAVTSTRTIDIFRGGFYNCEQSGVATYTFGAALTNAALQSSQVGCRFWFNNTGSANAVIAPSTNATGNLINNAAHTSNICTLAAGQWALFVGALSSGGTTYWSVITTGTIS